MSTLFLITARGGSKGIPGKNIKVLAGKPLLHYSIELARCFEADENICLSTDSSEIINCAEQIGLKVPFIRPAELATDTAGSYEVIIHALNFFEAQGKKIERIVLFQPTSPFRKKGHVEEALSLYNSTLEMVVSVKESHANPYYNLFKENTSGYLEKFLAGNFTRRQDAPKAFEYNGAIYVINAEAVRKKKLGEFEKVKKIVMDDLSSTDLDTMTDWAWAEFLIQNKLVHLGNN